MERVRGRFITQHRLESGLAHSLEVKDILWKNVNGGKATRAILHQVIRTTEQETGQSKVRTREGGAKYDRKRMGRVTT